MILFLFQVERQFFNLSKFFNIIIILVESFISIFFS